MYFHHPDIIQELVHERQQMSLEQLKRSSKLIERTRRFKLPRIKFEYKASQPEFVFRILFSG